MAHELSLMADGTYSMARAEGTEHSWHNLENVIPANAPFETWLNRSGMNFKILEAPALFLPDNNYGHVTEVSNRKVLYRSDTKGALSIVSDSYNIVQPKEVLYFFEKLCKKYGLQMDTAGVIQGGKKFWALAKTGMEFKVDRADRVKSYVLLGTSCDGTMSTVGKHTSMRVVCSNTFHVNMTNGEPAIKVNHSSVFNKEQMVIDLGIIEEDFLTFEEQANELHKYHIHDTEALVNYADLLEGKSVSIPEAEEMLKKSRKLQSLWSSFKEGKGAEDTVWGWFNGVTYYTDHLAGRTVDTRLNKSLFGSSNTLKQNAWKKSLELVGAA